MSSLLFLQPQLRRHPSIPSPFPTTLVACSQPPRLPTPPGGFDPPLSRATFALPAYGGGFPPSRLRLHLLQNRHRSGLPARAGRTSGAVPHFHERCWHQTAGVAWCMPRWQKQQPRQRQTLALTDRERESSPLRLLLWINIPLIASLVAVAVVVLPPPSRAPPLCVLLLCRNFEAAKARSRADKVVAAWRLVPQTRLPTRSCGTAVSTPIIEAMEGGSRVGAVRYLDCGSTDVQGSWWLLHFHLYGYPQHSSQFFHRRVTRSLFACSRLSPLLLRRHPEQHQLCSARKSNSHHRPRTPPIGKP